MMSMSAMIMGDYTGALSPGSRLEAVGRFLGVPGRWDFGIEDEFTCQLGYGDFEINIRTRNNVAEVERIWVELWSAFNGFPEPKKNAIRLVKHVKINLGKFSPGAPLSIVEDELERNFIDYKIARFEGGEFKTCIYTSTGCELYFYEGDIEPILMEIHFCSVGM